jgi:hypothetical protein
MVMPSKSKKQQDFMAAVANNPKFAKKAGVPQSVGKDYEKADKMKGMKKYQAGGRSAARRGGGGRKAGGKIYKAGGKVRGSGCATKGTRAAKMVTMKGS